MTATARFVFPCCFPFGVRAIITKDLVFWIVIAPRLVFLAKATFPSERRYWYFSSLMIMPFVISFGKISTFHHLSYCTPSAAEVLKDLGLSKEFNAIPPSKLRKTALSVLPLATSNKSSNSLFMIV